MKVKINQSIKKNFQYKLLQFFLFFFCMVALSPYPWSIPFFVPRFSV